MIIVDRDALGNPVTDVCPFSWCPFPPGPFHRHSIILRPDEGKTVLAEALSFAQYYANRIAGEASRYTAEDLLGEKRREVQHAQHVVDQANAVFHRLFPTGG